MKKTLGITGIDHNWGFDALVGLGVSALLVLLVYIFPSFAIGLPNVSSIAGVIGRALVIIVCASIFETALFFEFFLSFFNDKLKFPFIVSAILVSVAFALFHFVAYGESLKALSGSFISAGVIGFGWCYLKKYTKSILPLIVSHALLNAYLLSKLLVVIGMG